MARNRAGGVAEVPVSAKRIDDRSYPPSPPADVGASSRVHTAGTQLRRVARWRSTASPISRGRGRTDEDDGVTCLPLLQRDRPGAHVEEGKGTDHGTAPFEERTWE